MFSIVQVAKVYPENNTNEIYMFIIFKMAPCFNNAIRSPLYREELRSTEVNRTFLRPHAAPAC